MHDCVVNGARGRAAAEHDGHAEARARDHRVGHQRGARVAQGPEPALHAGRDDAQPRPIFRAELVDAAEDAATIAAETPGAEPDAGCTDFLAAARALQLILDEA